MTGMAQGREPRAWHLWRREFWLRPALVMLAAVLTAVMGVPYLLYDEVVDLRVDHRLDEGCCLTQVPGVLKAGHGRRTPGEDFVVVLEDGTAFDFDVADDAAPHLGAYVGGEVAAYLADDLLEGHQVVGVRTPDGELVRGWRAGARGLLLTMVFLELALGFAVGCGGYAMRRAAALQETGRARTRSGSWWAVGQVPVSASSTAGTMLVFPASLLLFGLVLGLPWWLLAGTHPVVAIGLYLWLRRRSRTSLPSTD